MKYKMIALDLDGTLNNDDKKITPKTRAALIEAQKKGAVVVLASGRPAPGLKRESDELELEKYKGLLLSYNGGRVVHADTNEILYEKGMTHEIATRLLRHLEAFPVTPIVDDGKHYYAKDPDGFMVEVESKLNNMGVKVVNNVANAIDFAPVKVLIAAPNETLLPECEKIMKPFDDELSFIQSTPYFLEATMKGISKASSLQTICDLLEIKAEEVMAFGDAQNDISMIEFAGLGVAMGNACDPLKEIADEITLSNNEDGIAHTLSKYFGIAV